MIYKSIKNKNNNYMNKFLTIIGVSLLISSCNNGTTEQPATTAAPETTVVAPADTMHNGASTSPVAPTGTTGDVKSSGK